VGSYLWSNVRYATVAAPLMWYRVGKRLDGTADVSFVWVIVLVGLTRQVCKSTRALLQRQSRSTANVLASGL
jgi:hypothetical protein